MLIPRSELYERLGHGEKARELEAERLNLGLVKQRGESYLHLPGEVVGFQCHIIISFSL